MQVEEMFRFPEEREWEAALRAMPKEDLLAALDRLAGAVPQPESDRQTAQACEALAGLREETERFLRTWRGRVDVFGDVPDRETFYRAFCALQRALEDGTQRLRGMAAQPAEKTHLTPRETWAVAQLSRGLIADRDITDAARAVQAKLEVLGQAEETAARRQALLRGLLQTALPAYAGRALEQVDPRGRGKSLRAGALCTLTAEFAAAVGECEKRLDETRRM